jgi:hypothetical protein
MVEALTLAGYAVVRQRTYDRLKDRVSAAEHTTKWQIEWREHNQQWVEQEFVATRRLYDRLTAIVAAAASLGVSIQAINKALDTGSTP